MRKRPRRLNRSTDRCTSRLLWLSWRWFDIDLHWEGLCILRRSLGSEPWKKPHCSWGDFELEPFWQNQKSSLWWPRPGHADTLHCLNNLALCLAVLLSVCEKITWRHLWPTWQCFAKDQGKLQQAEQLLRLLLTCVVSPWWNVVASSTLRSHCCWNGGGACTNVPYLTFSSHRFCVWKLSELILCPKTSSTNSSTQQLGMLPVPQIFALLGERNWEKVQTCPMPRDPNKMQ